MESNTLKHSSRSSWRSVAGYVYIVICLFDFLIMPTVVYQNQQHIEDVLIEIVEADDKKFALDIIDRLNLEPWSPVTLIGGGIFHISFGAILTGVAVTRDSKPRKPLK